MKKLLLFLLLSFLNIKGTIAQTTTKGNLTIEIFYSLYGNTADPNDYPATNYPTIYTDLAEGTTFEKIAKHLGYLEFQDGLSVLWRDNPVFNVNQIPYHASVIKALIEAWNVPLVNPNDVSLPYSDVDSSTIYYQHIATAYDIGMLSYASYLYPMNGVNLSTTQDYITFLSNALTTPSQSELNDSDNYFTTGIYTPNVLSQPRGIEQGVFSHYAKNSFKIPDRKFNLNFSHFYSTFMVEVPESYYAIKPMGRGWSHTYNSYILKENNVGEDSIDYYYIIWPDGTIHIFNEGNNEYESIGVYDDFDELSSGDLRITKKNQMRYYYEQLDNDRDIWYLVEIKDPNGNEIVIEYESAEEDDTRRIEYVEAPSGKRLEFDYLNGTDLLEVVEDPIGRELWFEYSDLWQGYYDTLVNFEDAKGNDTTYQYNIDNENQQYLLRRIDLPRGNQIEAEYDNDGKLDQYQINNDDPIEVDVNFDYENDLLTSSVDSPIPSGGTFTQDYTFNNNGLVTGYSSDTDDAVITYPTSGVNVTLPSNTNINGIDIEYDYDNDGNVIRIDKENGDVVEEFDYDNDNNLIEYTDPEGNITKFFYDNDENLIEIEDALGNSIFYTYDTHGQLLSVTNQEGITVNYTYETDGAIASITAPEGIESTFDYDGINRLLQRIDNGLVSQYDYDDNDNVLTFTNSGGFTTSYDYDANDNLTTITNANSINTSFTYDDEDRVIKEQFDNLIKQYQYGDEGFLEEYIKPSGQQIDYDYDNDGNIESTGTITEINYNSKNLVRDITNATGTITFSYDNLNLVDEVTTVHGYDVEYRYEDTGLVDEITYPIFNGLQFEVKYDYDANNRVSRVHLGTNNAVNNAIIAEFSYKDDDRLEHIVFNNDIGTRYYYDNAGRLNRIYTTTNLPDVSIIYENELELDNKGNILQEQETFQPITSGNNPDSSSETIEYNYDNNNHVLEAGGLSYNVNDDGNTATIGGDASLIYDVDDRLTNYTDVDNNLEFKYNAYGQRVEVIRNGISTKYVRDVMRDNILVDLDENNNPIHYYIYTPSGMLLASMKPDGSHKYYHGDTRGSVVAMTDENTVITHQYRYDDFGVITNYSEPESDSNHFRYVGTYGVEHELNDLYYMRARYYKPSIGRFLTEDPIWSTNLYQYADNNPISRVDPKGTMSFPSIFNNESYQNQYNDPVVDIDEFVQHHEGKTEDKIIYGESRIFGYSFPNNTDEGFRFVRLKNGKEVDIIHFFVVGRRGHLLGTINEAQQVFRNYNSAFYPQDIYSNELGIQFFRAFNNQIKQNPEKISEYIGIYFNGFD